MSSRTQVLPVALTGRLNGNIRYWLPAFGLGALLLAGMFGLCAVLPLRPAGWLSFIVLLIVPGYFLTAAITARLPLDTLERAAIALPLGIALLAVPGIFSLTLHKTKDVLLVGWQVMAGLSLAIYILTRRLQQPGELAAGVPWKANELLLAALLVGAFVVAYSTLAIPAMDGDLFTFMAGVSDARMGKPLNLTEPLFGSGLGVFVRSHFNQFPVIWILWSELAHQSPVDLTASVSRPILALWTLLASYTLGKAAGNGSRMFGLFVAAVQMLIYLAGPFLRADSVAAFFFQRTNADKYTISVTMLPVIFALAIRFMRSRRLAAFVTAALASFAVSAIHPLIAAMLAMGLAAFGGLHLVLNLRSRQAYGRVFSLGVLAGITMILPVILLVLSRSELPLAPTFPRSFTGWRVGVEQIPALPFVRALNIDWYGPLPELSELEAADANTDANPFLIWRYAFNMRRSRLIITDLRRYISDPAILLEPPYLLALLILPFLLKGIRTNLAAQFAVSASLAVVFAMYNPLVTPLIGRLVVPWLLWRLVWLLPYALVIAMGLDRLLGLIGRLLLRSQRLEPAYGFYRLYAPAVAIIGVGLLAAPMVRNNLEDQRYVLTSPNLFPTPQQLYARLDQETRQTGPVMVAASQNVSVTMPVFAPNANVIAHRVFNTSEFFPATMQDVALQRMIDQDYLFRTPYLTDRSLDILRQYDVRYVVVPADSGLHLQLSLLPEAFEWLVIDEGFSLYRVNALPGETASIRGNAALVNRQLEAAETYYQAALAEDAADPVANIGMAAVQWARGRFDQAVERVEAVAAANPSPAVQFHLGQLYSEMGRLEESRAVLAQVVAEAPDVPIYHQRLGDVCMRAGNAACARREYAAAVPRRLDEGDRFAALGARWNSRNNFEMARQYYEQAAAVKPSRQNLFLLAGVYQTLEMYGKAEQVLEGLRARSPLSAEVLVRLANLKALRGDVDAAERLYRRAIWLQDLTMIDSLGARLSYAQMLLTSGRLEAAEREITTILQISPYNTAGYMMAGDLYARLNQPEKAVAAYQQVLELDPTQSSALVSMRGLMPQIDPDENLDMLQRVVALNPTEPRVLVYLASQLRQLGNLDSAVNAYLRALDALEASAVSARLRMQTTERMKATIYSRLASVYEEQGNPAAAMNYYRAATQAYPVDPRLRMLLGDALRRRYRYAEAEAVYRAVIAEFPLHLESHLQLADLLFAQGDREGAAEVLQRAVDVFRQEPAQPRGTLARFTRQVLNAQADQAAAVEPANEDPTAVSDVLAAPVLLELSDFVTLLEQEDTPNALQSLAQIYELQGQVDQAIALYTGEIVTGELDSATLARYYAALGRLYAGQGRSNEALLAYQRSRALNSRLPGSWLGVANLYRGEGHIDRALAELERAQIATGGSMDVQLSLATTLMQAGENRRALEMLNRLAGSYPGNLRVHLALAAALVDQDYAAEAEAVLQRMAELYPASSEVWTQLGSLYVTRGRFDDAEELFRRANHRDQDAIEPRLALGELLVDRGRYREAIVLYEQTLAVQPRNLRVYLALAGVHQTVGQTERAAQLLDRAAEIDPTAAEPLLALARLHGEQGRPDEQQAALDAAAERAPTNLAVRQARAAVYRGRGQGQLALAELERAAADNPQSLEAQLALAAELERQGQSEAAAVLYRQAAGRERFTAAELRALAAAQSAAGDTAAARDSLERALELAPGETATRLQLAALLQAQGDVAGGLVHLRAAVERAPGQAQVWLALAGAQAAGGQPDAALASYRQAIAVEPGNLTAYGALLNAHIAAGRWAAAEDTLSAARRIAPGSYLVEVFAGRLLSAQLRWDEAETAFTAAIRQSPGRAEAHLALGDLLAGRLRYAEALVQYQLAQRIDPLNMGPYLSMAALYETMGQPEQGQVLLEWAVELDRSSVEPLLALARLHGQQGRQDEQQAALDAAVERAPASLAVRQARAAFFRTRGQGAAALAELQQAVAENPDSLDARLALAAELIRQGQSEAAAVIYRQVTVMDERPGPAVLRALATAAQDTGDPAGALAYLEQALAADPTDVITRLRLAGLLQTQGDIYGALAHLAVAAEHGQDQGQVWLALAEALSAAGQPASARAAYRQAIAAEPGYLPAYGALMDVYIDSVQWKAAEEVLDAARQAAPGSYQVELFAGRLYSAQARWAEAEAALLAAVEKAPGRSEGYFALGNLYTTQARLREAIEMFRRAVQLSPTNDNIYVRFRGVYDRMEFPEVQQENLMRSAYIAAVLEGELEP